MSILTFQLKPLLDIIAKTKDLPNRPTTDDLFDVNCWDTEPLDVNGLTEAEYYKTSGNKYGFWPDANKINKGKLFDSFSLVGDQGIYMMPNKMNKQNSNKPRFIVYATGCNPDIDEDFYENKIRLFGGDDGVIRIPNDWIKTAKANNNKELKIKISGDSVSLVSAKKGNRPKTLKPLMSFTLYGKSYQLISKAKTRGHWVAEEKVDKRKFNVTAKQLNEANFDIPTA